MTSKEEHSPHDGPDGLRDLRALLTEVRACPPSPTDTERLQALSGDLAHDLNNTLTGILVRIQLLLGTVPDAHARGQLRMIEQVASEGAWIVRRLQEFSRRRPGRPFAPIDLNPIVEEVALLAQSAWSQPILAKGVNAEVNVVTAPIPSIPGDAVELREALTAIMLSAFGAMPDGGRLTFRTGVDGEAVLCAIAHTGSALTKDERIRAFDPVFGARREKGKAHDLSAAYAAIVRHGGEITASSDGLRGAEFTIRLPITGTPAEGEAAPELDPSGTLETRGGAGRILIVDDSADICDVLSELLTRQGYAVVTAADGESALVEMENHPFRLAMVDIGLPGISGVEAATRIKLRWPETVVILMTGYSDHIGLSEAQTNGLDVVLTKPFSLDQVRSLINQAFATEAKKL